MSKTDSMAPLMGTSFRLAAAAVAPMLVLVACAQPGLRAE